MIILLMIILILAILYAREIKLIIASVFLFALTAALWSFWWGKIIVITLVALFLIGILGIIIERTEKKKLEKNIKDHMNPIEDELSREKAFLFGLEYWYKEEGKDAAEEIEKYRAWKANPLSIPELEKWYQENRQSF